jgi:hypothetical protein
MKSIILDIINNDKSYNKSATKMLRKTHPELWQEILEKTSFLPNTAKPKQRIWHILNDVFAIPLCPITNESVKWHENRYLTYKNFEASRKGVAIILKEVTKGEGHWRSKDSEKSKEANENFAKSLKSGKHKPWEDRNRDQKSYAQKGRQTCLDRYGVENGSQTKEARNKVSEARIRNGATPKHLRTERTLYYEAVWRHTEENWKKHFDKINPLRLNRSENALDHIYSIQRGFREGIPPYIIGHWTNLRIITLSENSIKGMRCDKTWEALFEDFNLNI